jgi:hypothetical protein
MEPVLIWRGKHALSVRLTLRLHLRGRGLRAEADAARRSPPLRLMRCGRRAAVILVS